MYAQVEKSKENKSRSVANSVAQKKDNRTKGFELVDNRPNLTVHKKIKADVINSPIQGKFIGELSLPLVVLNTVPLGLKDSLFDQFRKALESAQDNIAVVHGTNGYDAATKTVYLNKTMFDDIEKFKKQRINGAKGPIDAATIVSHVAAITHELSHARDNVIIKKAVSSDVYNVIETELRAWAFEAVAAFQAGKSLEKMDKEKGQLINGWLSITPLMLGNIGQNMDNSVINRLGRYLKRKLSSENDSVIQGWININEEWIKSQVEKFSQYAKKSLV